jgi:hypothetical protein
LRVVHRTPLPRSPRIDDSIACDGMSPVLSHAQVTAMRRASSWTTLVVIASLAQSACASQFHRAGVESQSVGDVVSGAELAASGAPSLYDALTRTRANYFTGRGTTSLINPPTDAILVFHSGALMGTSESLRNIAPRDVRVVRRISAMDTWHKYGRQVSVAGIEVEFVGER